MSQLHAHVKGRPVQAVQADARCARLRARKPCLLAGKRFGTGQTPSRLFPYQSAPRIGRPSELHNEAIGTTRIAAAAAEPAQPAVPESLFWKKVAGLALIFLGGTINYTILQSLRDAIIVTSCGVEALPFISAFGVLPASLLFFWYYDKLGKSVDGEAVFYWSLAPLAIFYAVFAAVLLPNANFIHPVALADKYIQLMPESLSCFVRVFANWSFTLFYIMAELWGSVAISVLFWSLADDLCSVDEAKDVYPKLGILANIGLIAAGGFTRYVTEVLTKGNEVLSLQVLVLAVLVVTGFMCTIKRYIDTAVLQHIPSYKQHHKKRDKKKKDGAKKQSTMEILRSSPRILNLTLLVMSYGITHKLFGFVWKGQMKILYPSATAYATVMSDVAAMTGATTVALMLISKFFFQYLGWRGAALMTPLVCLISGAVFFAGSMLSAGGASWLPGGAAAASVCGLLVMMAPIAGFVVQVFGRAAKYSLFDPSKEMVFITMERQEKEAGKGAVDLLGNQIGKSGGSWVMQAALLVFGSMAAAVPFAALFYVAVCTVWLHATLSLARTMDGDQEQKQVLASIDSTPLLEPPMPGKLIPAVVTAGSNGHLQESTAQELEKLKVLEAKVDKEVKESLQSHFD